MGKPGFGTSGRPYRFGELLRGHRLSVGLTQRELAGRAGISVRALRDIEQGRVAAPRARSVHRLATGLGLDTAARDRLLATVGAGLASVPEDGRPTIGVLGPLTVWRASVPLDVGSARLRSLLGLLAIQPGRPVGRAEITDLLWGDRPPESCWRLVQTYIAQLRKVLRPGMLVSTRHGYQLDVDADQLDLPRFDGLVARAWQAHQAGDVKAALDQYGQALQYWRGPVLADATPRLREHPVAVAVAARRVSATLAYADLAMELDRPGEAAVALRQVAATEPLHEGLAARLVLALAGSGQRAAALELFADVRRRLADELGVGPGPELRQAHLRVLRDEPGTPAGTESATQAPIPAQLPAGVGEFTGRLGALRRLDRSLPAGDNAVPIRAIIGIPGVGKTTLAVRWAQRVRDRFPDGQLYLDLRGYAPVPPVRPLQALATFLLALGVPAEQVPADLEQAAGAYRSRLAGKRVLVVLDNAHSADQVRPLLPGAAGCFVLVTSRDRLAGLAARDGAHRITLGPLGLAEARTLLTRTLGPRRTRAEPRDTTELAEACAGLPLALRIAAANLADQPGRTIASYVREMRSGDQLALLAVDGDPATAVRAVFDLSYVVLSGAARRLFRLLGLFPGPDLTVGPAAALAGLPASRAAALLDRLATVGLLVPHAPGRYGSHDLLRRYAADRAHRDDDPAEHTKATKRLYDWYLRAADAAADQLYPDKLRLRTEIPVLDQQLAVPVFDGPADALSWLDGERSNLVAAVQHAAEHGPRPAAWLLADVLRGYFILRRYTVDWLTVAEAGRSAARAEGDPLGQAAAQLSLADAHTRLSQYGTAAEHYREAAALAREGGWVAGQAAALGNLGGACRMSDRLADAAEYFRQSLDLTRQAGSVGGQASALINLGSVYWDLGQLAPAAEHYEEALTRYRQVGSRGGEGAALGNLGEVLHALGRLDDALHHLTRALALHRETGNRGGEADVLRLLAEVHRDAGRPAEALGLATAALALIRDTGERRYEADALNTVASAQQHLTEYRAAFENHRRARHLARQIQAPYTEVVALIGLATGHRHLDRPAQAVACARQAVTLARRCGYRPLEGQAHATLADIELALGRADRAVEDAQRALAVLRDTGHRLGQDHAELILRRASAELDKR